MKLSAVSRVLVPSALLLGLASGCASLPEPVATPNGQPLSVREHTETQQYTVKEKVGEVEYKNQSGQKIGSSDVYQNKVKTVEYQVWHAYQGNQQISDDDLYRIAQDEKAAREVQSKRETGVFLNRLGLGGLALGVLAAGAGYALASQQSVGDDPTLSRGLLYGGLITASAGGILTWVGIAKARSEHPLEQQRAVQAADNYNLRLGGGTTTTTAGNVSAR
jgi:hypothetical protein